MNLTSLFYHFTRNKRGWAQYLLGVCAAFSVIYIVYEINLWQMSMKKESEEI